MKELLQLASQWAVPVMLLVIPAYGLYKRVDVFEAFIEGAEEGFRLALRIAPFLIGILTALAVFRESGAMDLLLAAVSPLTSAMGIPREVVPLLFIRPLSGGASLGIVSELMQVHGADSFIGLLASTIQGSTDTTFYILTVYFGSVGVTRPRHALPVGLLADLTGFLAAFWVCSRVFGA